MGAYFERRGSGDKLYRKVLARYVHMAINGGIIQVIFPERGLSHDCRRHGAFIRCDGRTRRRLCSRWHQLRPGTRRSNTVG